MEYLVYYMIVFARLQKQEIQFILVHFILAIYYIAIKALMVRLFFLLLFSYEMDFPPLHSHPFQNW